MTGWAVTAGALAGTACWLAVPAGSGRSAGLRPRSLRPPAAPDRGSDRLPGRIPDRTPGRLVGSLRSRMARRRAERDDRVELAALTERLAALSRAGIAPHRAWQVLAAADGAGSAAARVVAAMLAGGGTVAAGLQLAAGQVPGSRLAWLAVAYQVSERAGTPSGPLLDRFADLVRAELTREQDRMVALAGPRATAALLTSLPLVAPLLGWSIGADPLAALVGSAAGRACLLLGLGFWWAGRVWSRRLVAQTGRAGR